MNRKEEKEIIEDCKSLLEDATKLEHEMKEMKRCVEFLIHEYKTNKQWFKPEGGRVTIEDVIKASFEFGWSSKRNMTYINEPEE